MEPEAVTLSSQRKILDQIRLRYMSTKLHSITPTKALNYQFIFHCKRLSIMTNVITILPYTTTPPEVSPLPSFYEILQPQCYMLYLPHAHCMPCSS